MCQEPFPLRAHTLNTIHTFHGHTRRGSPSLPSGPVLLGARNRCRLTAPLLSHNHILMSERRCPTIIQLLAPLHLIPPDLILLRILVKNSHPRPILNGICRLQFMARGHIMSVPPPAFLLRAALWSIHIHIHIYHHPHTYHILRSTRQYHTQACCIHT
jgi:hypothetical protein